MTQTILSVEKTDKRTILLKKFDNVINNLKDMKHEEIKTELVKLKENFWRWFK